jgi:hypothetical protein
MLSNYISYLLDSNQIHNDDSKFARQLKKLLRDEEDDRKVQKVIDLSGYLDQQENIKAFMVFVKTNFLPINNSNV